MSHSELIVVNSCHLCEYIFVFGEDLNPAHGKDDLFFSRST